MRKYLTTLHTKSPEHKKRFAIMTSASFTLLIFGFWFVTNFGVVDTTTEANVNQAYNEVSPLGSLWSGVVESFKSLKGEVGEMKDGLEVVNFGTEYQEMRDNTLDTYGQ